MSYRNNNNANRDALFGGGTSSGGNSKAPSYKQNAAANRDALFGGASSNKTPSSSSSTTPMPALSSSGGSKPSASSSSRPAAPTRSLPSTTSTRGSRFKKKKSSSGVKTTSVLSGEAKVAKMKEAAVYRDKAKKLMARGVFSRPDPISAGIFYKRAADLYQQCGENRLERLHRIASGDCQLGQDAFAMAAAEYTRAAELAAISDETTARKRNECSKLYSDAASAWRQMGEFGRAGECQVQAALSWLIDDDEDDDEDDDRLVLEKKALTAMEEAVEAFVPDPLNHHARYRQTGQSTFIDYSSDPPKPDMDLATQHVVKTPYAHEPLYQLVYTLVDYNECTSALYAAGAASYILSSDDFSTLSVSRAYAVETILLLAMGDVVAADKLFIEVHLQRTSYLRSRECKLSEDLIRAVKQMDFEELEEARSPAGSNRTALANLDGCMRELVTKIKLSGTAKSRRAAKKAVEVPMAATAAAAAAAKKEVAVPLPQEEEPEVTAAPPASKPPAKPGDKPLDEEELQASIHDNFAEMDALMDDMGLGDDEEEEELDDDDIDLR